MRILREYIRQLIKEISLGDYQIVVDGINARIMLGAQEIGVLETEPDGDRLQVQWSEVDEAHQGRGLGSAMYDELERQTGKKLVHGDIAQSPGALRLWRKRLGESEQWMLDYYIDGLYEVPGKIQDRLGLPYNSEDYTDEQVEQIARQDLGL